MRPHLGTQGWEARSCAPAWLGRGHGEGNPAHPSSKLWRQLGSWGWSGTPSGGSLLAPSGPLSSNAPRWACRPGGLSQSPAVLTLLLLPPPPRLPRTANPHGLLWAQAPGNRGVTSTYSWERKLWGEPSPPLLPQLNPQRVTALAERELAKRRGRISHRAALDGPPCTSVLSAPVPTPVKDLLLSLAES